MLERKLKLSVLKEATALAELMVIFFPCRTLADYGEKTSLTFSSSTLVHQSFTFTVDASTARLAGVIVYLF